jgi:hypothetical protein
LFIGGLCPERFLFIQTTAIFAKNIKKDIAGAVLADDLHIAKFFYKDGSRGTHNFFPVSSQPAFDSKGRPIERLGDDPPTTNADRLGEAWIGRNVL